MSELTPGMEAALGSGRALVLALCRLDLKDGRIVGFLTGSGEVAWGGITFRGTDPTFGSILAVEPPSDGYGDEAPGMSFQVAPPDGVAVASLADPAMQGSRVRWWVACLDDNGAVIADPWLWYDGSLDVPEFSAGKDDRVLDLSVVSEMEKLFLSEEGRRLSDSSHREIWPGESGLAYVTGLTRTIIWGPGERPPGISYNTTPGAGTGSGAGGYSREQIARSLPSLFR
jgi:hypothetical protein